MRRLIAALVLLCASTPALAETSRRHLALGGFEERGRGVRGHGQVLKTALAYELSHTGAFQLVADDEAKRAAISKIKDTNRHSVDERHWVQVGQAVGATHLLLGEVRQDRNTCTAFAQLVHLESRATKVTRPEYYDCTNYDLVELAGDLAAQLSGQRASPANARRHRRPPQPPVEIVMEGRAAKVDGEDYTFYELDRAHAEAPAPAAAPDDDDQAPPPAPTEPPPPSEEPAPTPRPEPPAAEAPPRLPPPPADLDLDRFPALRPVVDGEGRPLLNLYALARHLDRRGALVAGLVLGLPVLFLLVGVLLLRAREACGEVWLRFGFSLSVLFASAAAATLLLYRYGLHRAVTEDTAAYLVAAPFAALALWLVGGRLMHVLALLPWFRQLLWAALLTATIFALLLLATQLQAHVAWYGASLLFLWLALRAMVALRRRRKLA